MSAQVNLSIWDHLSRAILFLIVVAIVMGGVLCYWPLLQQNERIRQRILEWDQKITQQDQLDRQLRASIEAMRTDSRTVERLAREKLGYAKPGETVIRFEENNTVTSTPIVR